MADNLNKYLSDSEAIYREFSVTPLTLTLVQHGFHDPLLKKYFKQWYLPVSILEFKQGAINWYFSPEFFRGMSHYIVNRLKEDKTLAETVLKESRRHGEKALGYAAKLRQLIDGDFSQRQAAALLAQLFREAELVCAYGWIPVTSDIYYFNLSRELESIIDQYCQKTRAPLPAKEYLSTLTLPLKPSQTWLYKKSLYELALEAAKQPRRPRGLKALFAGNAKLRAQLDKVVKEFSPVNYGHVGPALTNAEVLGEVAALLKSPNLKKDYQNFAAEKQKIAKQQAEVSRRLGLDSQAKYLVGVARDFIDIKGYRLEILYATFAVLDLLLKKIFAETKSNYRLSHLKQMSKFELTRFLKTGSLPPAADLAAREKYLVYTAFGSEKNEMRTGDKGRSYLKRYVVYNKDKTVRFSVHGNVACSGKVTGAVKIVNVAKEMGKVNKGDILVATQTTPELLPAMKKAAAFVTDIGGITSHAAIVSREMNKPCVIGTKIATQVFKDGDRVEVDANKGVVRKI